MEQGFTKPNRNAASWDADVNANFTLIEKGYLLPLVVGPTTITSGQLVTTNNSGFAVAYNPSSLGGLGPLAVSLAVTSPGNTAYFLTRGALGDFAPYSGQFSPADPIYPSITTPGWVTNCLQNGALYTFGRCLNTASGQYLFDPVVRANLRQTHVQCGFAHCASTTLGVFSFGFMTVGNLGICDRLRIITRSCNSWRITLYANSARTTTLYDTVVNSGNIGVTTMDMIDDALFRYNCTDTASVFAVYGQIEVLSTAFTTINSDVFNVQMIGLRLR